jgi:uncharacterized protein YndB with AHSA1/START domain
MSSAEGHWLRITRVLPAPREEVWRAMTDPEHFGEWWGPKEFTCPSVEWEPRVGGSYRIEMQPPDGEPFHLNGEFREVDPPNRLAFTFVWDPSTPDDRETLATLSLEEQGDKTEVRFTQGEFATEERRALHDGGWSDSFERLESLLPAG